MIAIFTVLGLVLFGGGAYAIFDGWPYMVLERGFTQVIIGSIASSAGLILLSFAWVLRELGAVRRSLTDAVQARAESSAQIAMERARALRDQERPETAAPILAPTPTPVPAPALAPVVGGLAAGAVAAGAAANVLAEPAAETVAFAAAPRGAERDLFGTLVARQFEETEQQRAEEPEAQAAAEPLPDMFEGTAFAPSEEAQDAPVAVETESHEPAEIVSAKIQPVGEDEALAHAVEPFPAEPTFEGEEDAPKPHLDTPEPVEAAKASSDLDEFSALRESLVGHLNEPLRSDARIEPSLAPEEEDPFAEAEAWMDRASPRKEPWFETQAANEPEPSGTGSPPWPPRTEAHEFPEPVEPVAQPATEIVEPATAEVSDDDVEEPAAAPETVENAAEDGAAPSPDRPASGEGIVGAYQVGDAHFTIYADGSIQARTPDGEFSFASMDELKAYLASEKNRLGT